jgi:4-hydroxy-tetrahydrodipicolinate reductase
MTRIAIFGAKGRMGREVLRLAENDPRFVVVGVVDQGDDPVGPFGSSDVVIDFSHHSATPRLVELCAELSKPLVTGTTGHTPQEKERIAEAARRIPIVAAPNFSFGVSLLLRLVRDAARVLSKEGYQAEILEIHHSGKRDAPSGTACHLAELLAQGSGKSWRELARFGRVGETGPRSESEIGIHSLRGGDVVGEHTVIFFSDGERVELAHRAWSRTPFAAGALRAALWVQDRSPGLYGMEDVLEGL